MDNKITGSSPASPDNLRIFEELNLTRVQAATFCAFPPNVISYAVNALNDVKKTDEPYQTLYKLCLDYCRINATQIDYKWAKQMRDYAQAQIVKGRK